MKAGFKSILNYKHPFERKKMFKQKNSSKFSTTLLALIMGASVFIGSPAVAKEMIQNVWGELQERPRYGGSISVIGFKEIGEWGLDNYYTWAGALASGAVEMLGVNNWATPRNVDHMKNWWRGDTYKGGLAVGWESPDLGTSIFHLRRGVRWHNLPPTNGREFVADDVVYVFNRLYGLVDGFEKSPHNGHPFYEQIISVKAIDKYTVEFKHPPHPYAMTYFMTAGWADQIAPPREVVEKFGDMKDPANVRGTGPWMVKDYRAGVSMTWQKNPDYWGYDELFPDHKFQLPYADEFKQISINDRPTRLAAIRTAKLDVLSGLTWTDKGISWEEKESLEKTTPDLKFVGYELGGRGIVTRFNAKPFYPDIRVRKALQMAINLDEIAKTWGGGVSKMWPPEANQLCWNYCVEGAYTPFDQLPESIQEGYTYNPKKAKQLLADAGYPNGFKTIVVMPSDQNTDLMEIAKSYLAAIGVDMEIKLMERAAFQKTAFAGNFEMSYKEGFGTGSPDLGGSLGHWGGPEGFDVKPWNIGKVNDESFNALLTEADNTDSLEAFMGKMTDASDYWISQHWMIALAMSADYRGYWPWLKSYRGEYRLGKDFGKGQLYARVWVDQELKKSMGY